MNVSVFKKHQVKIYGLYYNAITNKFNTVVLGRVKHSTMALTGAILQAIRL
ncbi:hypothetical protein [Psychrobacter sp.]|uniref:hypothetical protein n=1 Tax=Psychrobacter sp. TaxID=56811 RepID=UPI0035656610